MKAECGEPCYRRKYYTTDKVKWYPGKSSQNSYFSIQLDPRAMSYQTIIEERAVTVDELVGIVPGYILSNYYQCSPVSHQEDE